MIFFLGTIFGAAIIILWALYLAARKPKANPATSNFHAVGVGNGSLVGDDRTRINEILKAIDRQTLTEISKVQ
jgi:hypothetical protein